MTITYYTSNPNPKENMMTITYYTPNPAGLRPNEAWGDDHPCDTCGHAAGTHNEETGACPSGVTFDPDQVSAVNLFDHDQAAATGQYLRLVRFENGEVILRIYTRQGSFPIVLCAEGGEPRDLAKIGEAFVEGVQYYVKEEVF